MSKEPATPQKKLFDFAFGKENYILMIVGLVVLAIGYLLMVGGGSEDPNIFNEELFNTRRLVVSPLVLLAGIIIEIVAIMKKPIDKNDKNDST
ncbi:MAG: DUF3098 domain-containing protein, partial [Bacteroidales bacterium]